MRVMEETRIEIEGTSKWFPMQSSVSPLWTQEQDVKREELELGREHEGQG